MLVHCRNNYIQYNTRCTWNEQPCSLDEFDVTVTDFGFCYTFNHGHHYPVKQVATNGNDVDFFVSSLEPHMVEFIVWELLHALVFCECSEFYN